jgi:hypothetical protein
MSEKLSLRTNANGDIYVYIEDSVGASLAFGADSANGVVALNTLATPNVSPLEATANLTLDPTANGDILLRPHGTGKSEFNTGNVQVTAGDVNILDGNINMTNTSAAGDTGVITLGGTRFLHNQNDFNTYVGNEAGPIPGVINVAHSVGIGYQALNAPGVGSQYNTAVGSQSLLNPGGESNTAIGYRAGFSLAGTIFVSGENNTLLGTHAGISLLTGSDNCLVGYLAGSDYTAAESNNICISNVGIVGESNAIHIGTNASHLTCFIAGIDGVNVGSVSKVVTMASDKLGTATITAGTGITVTPTANTITIAGVGGGVTWTVITINQTAVINNGYFCNKAGTLALALPAASAVGDVIEVININTTTGTQFTQAAGQQIFFAGSSTTLGVGGTLTSTQVGDTIKLICRTANLTWFASSIVGNWTNV